MVAQFDAYDPDFHGGVSVAVADVTGDGIADIITGSGPGMRPNVRVFSANGDAFDSVAGFYPYDDGYSDGVNVAAADLTGDGVAEIVTGVAPGAPPDVRIFTLSDGSASEIDRFFAYGQEVTAGVHVAAGEVTGAGVTEVVTGTGPGAAPLVRVLGANGAELASFYAFDPASNGGVRVAAGNGADNGGGGRPLPPDRPTRRPPAQDPAPFSQLRAGEEARSADGRCVLVYQGDGNLVLYDANGTALWSSGTAGVSTGRTVMQGDGNLVIYDGDGTAVWASGTAGHPGARLIIQNDSNVVVYDRDNVAVWSTGTAQNMPRRADPPAPPTPSPRPGRPGAGVLAPGATLQANGAVASEDGRYSLTYQGDGNLVLYDESRVALWATGTAGTDPGFVAMQGDGNLVVYDSSGTPVWASWTDGHPNARLCVQPDGNVVIYDGRGEAIWSTNTVGQ